jgi:hypothetical protein
VPAVAAQRIARRCRGRALTASVALVVALTAAGCAGGTGSGATSSSNPPIVTGEQVVTSCFHNYFYNGILPKASAQANCETCVVGQLRKLGIRPTAGATVLDMLTGVRLSSSTIQKLQNVCNITDAGSD